MGKPVKIASAPAKREFHGFLVDNDTETLDMFSAMADTFGKPQEMTYLHDDPEKQQELVSRLKGIKKKVAADALGKAKQALNNNN